MPCNSAYTCVSELGQASYCVRVLTIHLAEPGPCAVRKVRAGMNCPRLRLGLKQLARALLGIVPTMSSHGRSEPSGPMKGIRCSKTTDQSEGPEQGCRAGRTWAYSGREVHGGWCSTFPELARTRGDRPDHERRELVRAIGTASLSRASCAKRSPDRSVLRFSVWWLIDARGGTAAGPDRRRRRRTLARASGAGWRRA